MYAIAAAAMSPRGRIESRRTRWSSQSLNPLLRSATDSPGRFGEAVDPALSAGQPEPVLVLVAAEHLDEDQWLPKVTGE